MSLESPLEDATLGGKLRNAVAQIPHVRMVLALVWEAAPRLTSAWLVLLTLQGILPAATVRLTRVVVDNLAAVGGQGSSFTRLQPVLVPAGLMALLLLAGQLLRGIASYVRVAQSEAVRDHIMARVHSQSAAVDLAFYETPEYYDRLFRARSDAHFRPLSLLDNLGSLLQNGITLVAMATVLLPYGMWLPVALFFSTVPAFGVVVRYAMRENAWRRRVTPDERRAWYYDWLLTDRSTAAELRLFNLGAHFQDLYQALRRRLRQERLGLAREQGRAELAAGVAGLAVTAVALWWMLRRVGEGSASLGDLALFYQAFSQGQGLMRNLLESVGQIYANSLFLGHLFAFLELRPGILAPDAPRAMPTTLADGIRFEDVRFRYPGSERPALDAFNLHLPAGKIAAVVGANGAGKTTLIKLICRLYDPEAGRVSLDGVDLRDLPLGDLRRAISVLFQEPVHYGATLAENIALGDLAAGASQAEIAASAAGAGADTVAGKLPKGYATLLGKWFAGGADLSVGEWQRVALARAFLRRAPILLLDEPTSAMDAWAESDWLSRFRQLAAGRTAVIITHRFTTAMRADIIYVMDDGHIVESGHHSALLAQHGPYARSWATQMAQADAAAVPPVGVPAQTSIPAPDAT